MNTRPLHASPTPPLGVLVCALAVAAALTLTAAAATPRASHTPLSSEVKMHFNRPTIFINGSPESPVIYALTDVPGGRWSWEELPQHNIRQFCAQGIRLFQVDLFFDHCWMPDGTIDISSAVRQIAGVLSACPDAGVFFRFHVTAPKWWMRNHPEEWARYADVEPREESNEGMPRIIEDDNGPTQRVSMASALWKSEATEKLRAFLNALAATPEGNALAGVQVANGIYGEWHNWGFFRNEPDVSPPMEQAFRTWLRARYGTDAELRKAWQDPGATLAGATVPGMADRITTAGIFRDPRSEQRTIDYYTCAHELVADNILHFGRTVKDTWPRPLITGTFYGYFFSVFGRQAAGGHLELHRILRSPDIDYLSGPQAYEPEALKLGEAYRSRSLIATIRLNGKLWLDEMDAEPTIPNSQAGNYDQILANGIAAVRRNVLFSATKGMGLWYYDFGVAGVDLDGFQYNARGSRGTWDHSVILEEIRKMKRLVDDRLSIPYRSDADVLFVYDTRSFYHTASLRGSDPVSNVLIDYATLAAFKSGVVFDPVHMEDLPRVDLAQYKVVVFGNVYLLTDEQRRDITGRVAGDGRTLVWFYAPGYSNGRSLSATAISALTGIRVSPMASKLPPEIDLNIPSDSASSPVTGTQVVAPLFSVRDPDAEIRGRFRETGEGAIAFKTFRNHRAWYVAIPNTGTEPLRHILRSAGAHVYARKGEIVYAGGGLLVVHMKEGGKHEITLRSGKQLTFTLPPGAHTLVLDPDTGALLLPIGMTESNPG
ncbi:MAG: beta-galactosidase [Bacteroidetes bacterium]|nr:beta-galactosidase [Bacteroidota bacterium]